jgi:hypothetical protein
VLDHFKRALARVQSDYGFYIQCQVDPALALATYDLTPEERQTLSEPGKLAEVLKSGVGIARLPSITIKISGSHDWVNRAATEATTHGADRGSVIARELDAIRGAITEAERTEAAVRLIEQLS